MYSNTAFFAGKNYSIGVEVCPKIADREKRYDFFMSLLFFCRFGLSRAPVGAFKQLHWPFGPRSPPSGFDFQQIQILEVTNVKNSGKKVIEIEGRKIEVSEEVYKEYQRGQRKDRYIMKDLKRGTIKIEGEKVSIRPSREDSMERLIDTHPQYFVEANAGPEELLVKKDLLDCLEKAIHSLSAEEWQLIQELYYLEHTEREVSATLSIAKTTLHRRKKDILAKLRKKLEEK